MPNTYTQIHIQFVFAVKFRDKTISKKWKDDLYKYITGIVQNQSHKLLAINGMSDHVHMLVGLPPSQSISELMQYVKKDSSRWINDNELVKGKFEWQEGYGAFSYGASQIDEVIKYIDNQEEHHRKKTFREEYIDFLTKFKVEYDERYILHDPI
jgi:REP element-mobilizing transposase RayT